MESRTSFAMMRPFLSLLLALALALTSQSMAVARGASAATGQMVICTGAGPMAVFVDAQGQPTSAPHICPDAALLAIGGVAIQPAALPGQAQPFAPPAGLQAGLRPSLPRPAPPARAPPVLV